MKMTIALNDGWAVASYDSDQYVNTDKLPRDFDLSLSLPGDVNAALVRAGRMPNPHYAANGRDCYWVTSKDWWLRKTFSWNQAGSYALVLDGVDGIADVFLNGRKLGVADNAFHPHRFDVSDLLQQENELLLRFRSIEKHIGEPRSTNLGGEGWFDGRTLFRKPQYNFGWDWSLPLPSIGVLGGIRLEQTDLPEILNVAVRTFCSGVDFDFEVNKITCDAGHEWRVEVSGHGETVATSIDGMGYRSFCSLQLQNPQLWWPHGLGEPNLYDYAVELIVDGEVADRRTGRFGLRETTILEEPFTEDAGPGRSFWIVINGQRCFCKGGNWIPLELWPEEVTEEQYRFYLRKTVEANFNIQRVWGGGIYERDIFYALCDELGILVWQDFRFASNGYPVDHLRNSIVREANHQIRRLRNHPSIVIWCGCNEDVYSWSVPGDPSTVDAMADMDANTDRNRYRNDPALYTMLLRGLVGRHGLGVPYVESSPMSANDIGNDRRSGNCHLSSLKFTLGQLPKEAHFREHFERGPVAFNSEFCIHGPPCESTMRRLLSDDHAWPPSDVWTYHIQTGHHGMPYHDQVLKVAEPHFGPIPDLSTYVKHGQALHMEMMRSEFESARCDRPNNGGTMMWMFNDCWPTANWSIIDYYRVPKPSYYAARRACADVLPTIFERGGRIGFFLSNDTNQTETREVEFGWMTLDGTVLQQHSLQSTVPPVSTATLLQVQRDELPPGLDVLLFIRITGRPTISYFPNGWLDVPWPEASFEIDLHGSELRVTATSFLRMFHVICNDPGIWVDDNFVDIIPGESRLFRLSREVPESELAFGSWVNWLSI